MANQILVQSTASFEAQVSNSDPLDSIDEISKMVAEQEGEFAFKKLPDSSLKDDQREFAAGEGI